MGNTAVQKILARAAGKRSLDIGEVIYPEPDYVIMHDLHAHIFLRELWEMGVRELWDPDRVIVVIDHQTPGFSARAAAIHKQIREWVLRFEISNFFDIGNSGITHQLQIERGFARPGTFIVSKDVHSPNAGAVGSLAIPLIYDVPAFLALGTSWIRVPETTRINLKGKASPGVLARDIAQTVSAQVGYEQCDYQVVEWGGDYVDDLSIDGRQVLCNLAIEVGAKSSLVNADMKAVEYVRALTRLPFEPLSSDADAAYSFTVDFDVSEIEPQVAAPPSPDNVCPVSTVAGKPVQHAFVGSCAGGMLDDLRAAANILRGRKIAPGVRMLVSPSTDQIYRQAMDEGLLKTISDSGATVFPPGCTACPGYVLPLADGERSISTGTRNEPGRMGSSDSEIFLASAFTVAASAVAGQIVDPRSFLN